MSTQATQPENAPVAEEPSLFGTFIGGAVVLLALGGWLGWEFYTAAGSLTWPAAEGTMKTFKVWEKKDLSGGGSVQYQVDVNYEYTVNGQSYTGQTFNSRNNHVDQERLPELERQYAPGQKVQVAYSNFMPSQSVLVREVSATAWGKLVIAVLSFLGAAACAYFAFQKPAPAQSA